MNFTTTLLTLILVPIISLGINSKLVTHKRNNLFISAISAGLLYFSILINVAYIQNKYEVELGTFDLNNDGVFSEFEITSEQEKAMHNVIADTGRTFAPFTGAVLSLIYFFLMLALFKLINFLHKQYLNKTHNK